MFPRLLHLSLYYNYTRDSFSKTNCFKHIYKPFFNPSLVNFKNWFQKVFSFIKPVIPMYNCSNKTIIYIF